MAGWSEAGPIAGGWVAMHSFFFYIFAMTSYLSKLTFEYSW